LLGAGGMGQVFASDHPRLGRIAVKLMPSALDVPEVARAFDEAEMGARVRHPNVVRIFDHGMTHDGVPFLAMEHVRGLSLGTLVRTEGPLPLVRIRAIASQLLAGLAAIHREGLVHADLKSDNILIDLDSDHITIIDFGLARPSKTKLRDDDQIVSGTPEYMAPELIRGATITASADFYAVGVILYELLTGTTPFTGGSTGEVFTRHLEDDVVPPSLRYPDRTIPAALETQILQALAKDPDKRPSDALAFARAIRRAIPETSELEPCFRRVFTTIGPTRPWIHVGSLEHATTHRAPIRDVALAVSPAQ
ncbi:MAG TPA: serine/threonine-protein kinase, partial [Kofleriaceae bacterium]